MKYGKELNLRSVPEWRAHNIDYNEIKLLIRRATDLTPGIDKNKRVAELYSALSEEYNRINLFVKSKSGEIDRRIANCQNIVDELSKEGQQQNCNNDQLLGNFSLDSFDIKQGLSRAGQSKLYHLHQELEHLTRDIQSLSRFIGAQRTGFRKLLKKYTKWSKSDSLKAKFQTILDNPESFVHEDLTSSFLQLSVLYDVLRSSNPLCDTTNHFNTADLEDESLSKFDCDMVTYGTSSFTAWIHQDNIMEIKLQLLKHMTLYSSDAVKLKRSQSYINTNILGMASRRTSTTSEGGESDRTGVVFLDNKKKLLSVQTRKEPGQIRWVKEEPSSIVLCSPTGGLKQFSTMKLSEDQLQSILDCNYERQGEIVRSLSNTTSKLAMGWCEKRHVHPLAKVFFERTRFISSSNETTQENSSQHNLSPRSVEPQNPALRTKAWAAIDNNLSFTASGLNNISANQGPASQLFPHAIFEIRWSGPTKPDWMLEIESSHLLYPIPEFSVFLHSISIFYPTKLENLPTWLKILEDNVDIRRLPTLQHKRKTSVKIKRGEPVSATPSVSTSPTYPSILLNDKGIKDDYFNINNQDIVPGTCTPSDGASTPRTPRGPYLPTNNVRVKYWNEFDDPEDVDDEFGVFVIPEEDDNSSGLFSDSNVEKLIRASTRFIRGIQKAGGKLTGHKYLETDPLLSEGSSIDEEDTEEEEDYYFDERSNIARHTSSPRLRPKSYRYETFPDEEISLYHSNQRDNVLTFLYCMCFFLSALLLSILYGVILGEESSAISVATFIFINVAEVFALLVAILGMCFFMLRSIPGWIHQTLVLSTFFSIICLGIGSIAYLWSK